MRRFSLNRPRLWYPLLIVAGLVVWNIWPLIGHAQTATTFSIESVGGQIGIGDADLRRTIINIIRIALGLVTLLGVGYLIYGGYLWLTSGGNERQVEKAKQVILQALIGLVIILLAWAIVTFVARTFANVTTNGNSNTNSSNCDPAVQNCLPPDSFQTFDLTAITTCAERPNYSSGVPRSSAVSLTFNTNLNTQAVGVQGSVAYAVAGQPNQPKLEVQKCTDSTCANLATPPNREVDNQQYSGATPSGAAGTAKVEWVAKDNTITLYHTSFSNDPNSADYLLFQAGQTYRLVIPRKDANTALMDIQDRVLEECRRDNGLDIEGDGCEVLPDRILWKFTVGADDTGPALQVAQTVPSSSYASGNGAPERNVPPQNTELIINYNNAIDWASVSSDNFRVYKFTTPPNTSTGQGGTVEVNPVPAGDFDFMRMPDGRGISAKLKPGKKLDSFTWYRVVVENVRNLCGTTQEQNPFSWVFETNDAVAGVRQVYPTNGFDRACPSTEIFIQFNTSMRQQGSFDCQVGANGSLVTDGATSPASGRQFRVMDQYDPANPNGTCTTFAFTPESVGLTTGATYHVGVNTDMVVDIQGNKLSYGDVPPANQSGSPLQQPWSFKVATAQDCVQPPYISSVSPTSGQAGACVSVIGNHFEKQIGQAPPETDGQNTGDKLALGLVEQATRTWQNTYIVSSVDPDNGQVNLATDQEHDYKVTVKYPEGDVTSNAVRFRLESGTGTAGPCLLSLDPGSGPVGISVEARGENFGAAGLNSKVLYSGYPNASGWTVNKSLWTNTLIGPKANNAIIVSNGSQTGTGTVRVVDNNNRLSNGLPFTVTAPVTQGPGAPSVSESTSCNLLAGTIPSPNPPKNDTQACLNQAVTVRFDRPMDPTSINATSALLEKCSDGTCSSVTSVTATVTAGSSDVTLQPSGLLTADTNYRVTLTTAIKSAAPDLKPLSSPYVWQFKTKSGTATCAVDGVAISPPGPVTVQSQNYTPIQLTAQPTDAACRTLVNNNYTYAWSSTVPPVGQVSGTGKTILVAPPAGGAAAGSTNVTVQTEGKTSGPFGLTVDPLRCNTNADCATNGLGEACPTSTCQNNVCTMVVTGLEPADGNIGTWTTVKGCWFGGFDNNKSKVMFGGDVEGLAPNSLVCGAPSDTWTNERIVREVPNRATAVTTDDAISGAIKVIRSDSQTADGPTFTVNNIDRPGLCRLNPDQGIQDIGVVVSGSRFGATRNDPAQDKVTITKVATGATAVDMTDYPSWADSSIGTKIPIAAELGANEVRVKNDTQTSNPWPFMVQTQAGCTQLCTQDSQCNTAGGEGCSVTSHCCALRPTILTTQPAQGASNICRNTSVQVEFDQPLDNQTVNTTNVKYTDNGQAVNGSVQLNNSGTNGTIIYQPGLISAGKPQQLTLDPAIRGANGVGIKAVDPANNPLKFTSSSEICALERVVVAPNAHRFTSANTPLTFTADAYPANSSVPLARVAEYSWDWDWISSDATVATVTNANRQTNQGSETVRSLTKNGATTITAKAKVTVDQSGQTVNRERQGESNVVVELCENPWLFTDAASNCDSNTGSCPSFNFTLSYCKGNGTATLLPDFGYTGSNGQLGSIEGQNAVDTTRLKSYFFKESATSRDTIGLLIFRNANLLSPSDWYALRFPSDRGTSTTTVAGYPAVQIGTTTYVGVTNLNAAGQLEGLMMVFDYNSNNASEATKQIYAQLLRNVLFNTNSTLSAADRVAIQNDTKRLQDIASVKTLLTAYKQKNGGYPALAAGSYVTGLSTSAWPSWQATLSSALGRTLPSDPNNKFSPQCAAPYEAATCWAEPLKQFKCTSDASHVYLYNTDATGSSFKLYASMEYKGQGKFAGGVVDACSGRGSNSCPCFNYQIGP